MPNRLASETSPYLLQHAGNPVDWWPWCDEAIARARAENRPIFLSIGYAACHWCHVMEHESFENEEIARYLNEHFVCIKVDREERPDLDQVYMNAVQAMTGRGGWPMSVFLTGDLQPFFGGTYWPPHDGRGMPGFLRVLQAVIDAWQNRRESALAQAAELTQHLRQLDAAQRPDGLERDLPGLPLLESAQAALLRAMDHRHGGFGQAPKFPHPMQLQFLLRMWRRTKSEAALAAAVLSLDKMQQGGMYDHLGGGFARYSVDERWLVPHFEKMLYDNALLISAYLDGYLATGRAEYAQVCRETCDYLLRDMADPAGGFHSSEDADSEGVEGKFYVWTPAELRSILGEACAERFASVYDVTPGGNFEHGQSILHLPKTLAQAAALHGWNLTELQSELAESRAKLLSARKKRVRPGKDDKILVNWNALAIEALARTAGALDEPRYAAAAARAADFILKEMRREDGRLLHAWRNGRARFPAYLDDFAALANSLVTLYEATFEERYIDEAVRLADVLLARFRAAEGGFYFTSDDHERLITRHRDLHDSSTPGGSALAATALTRLSRLCGRADYDCAARESFDAAAEMLARQPLACGQMLLAVELHVGPLHELVLVGDPQAAETQTVLAALRHAFFPHHVIACRARPDLEDGSIEIDPIFHNRVPPRASPALFVCADFTCHTPASGKAACLAVIDKLARLERADEAS